MSAVSNLLPGSAPSQYLWERMAGSLTFPTTSFSKPTQIKGNMGLQWVPIHADPGENTSRPVVRLAKKEHVPISQSVTEARGVGLVFILWVGEEVFRMLHTHTCPVLHDLLSPSLPSQLGPR